MILCLTAIVLGGIAAFYVPFVVPLTLSKYIAIGILGALDSVFGGISASLQKNFNIKVFISGFFANAALAVALTYAGDKLALDLYLVAIIVFGTRMFQNFAVIRRFLLSNKSSWKKE